MNPNAADLSRFDGPLAAAAKAIERPAVFNGVYTIEFPDGSHRTFRIHTKKETAKFAPGQRVLSILIGPDRSGDWDGFAFVTDDGFRVWKRHQGTKLERYANLLWMMATGCDADGHTLTAAKHCSVCGRLLTTPTALERGIGDTCWERLHG